MNSVEHEKKEEQALSQNKCIYCNEETEHHICIECRLFMMEEQIKNSINSNK